MQVDKYIEESPTPRRLRDVIQKVLNAINGLLSFGTPQVGRDNINGAWATGVTPNVADQEFAVTHNLNRIPVGFLVFSIDQAGSIYKGATAWTTKQVFLKSHQTGMNFVLFIT